MMKREREQRVQMLGLCARETPERAPTRAVAALLRQAGVAWALAAFDELPLDENCYLALAARTVLASTGLSARQLLRVSVRLRRFRREDVRSRVRCVLTDLGVLSICQIVDEAGSLEPSLKDLYLSEVEEIVGDLVARGVVTEVEWFPSGTFRYALAETGGAP